MKTSTCSLAGNWFLFLLFHCLALSSAFGKPKAPDSLSISPSTIANNYAGAVDLTITGLDSAGQTVVVEEFLDVDHSGTINAGDLLVRKFNVTDGQVTSIGGQRNLNVPGDEDGTANSAILTRLLYSASEVPGRIDGTHIFRVSPSGAGFTPFTASLTVTQQDYAGSGVSGTVTGGGAQPGALVFLITAGIDGNLIAATVSGAGGAYSIKAAPGAYVVAAAKSGFVFNIGAAPTINVASGSFVTNQSVPLLASGRTISGTARDATSLTGVPAVFIQGRSNTGFLAFTTSDGTGNYVMDATTDPWGFGFDELGVARHGLFPIKASEGSVGNVTGYNLDLPRATALIYGSVKTPAAVAVPFADIKGQTNGSPNYKSAGVSDASGNYSLGTIPTSWRVNSDRTGNLGLEVTTVVNTAGSAVLQNLVSYPITAHIRGVVRDNHNNLVPSLRILARDISAGMGTNINSNTQTDANGAFDLGVFGGGGMTTRPWQIQVDEGNQPSGYVSTSPTFNVQDGVDINGVTYIVYVVTAHLRGQVLDENDAPLGNVNIAAGSGMNGEFFSGVTTDGGGNFDIGVFGGTWTLGLSNITGLGIIPQDFTTNVTDGVDQNGLIFRVRHTTATIAGTVMNASMMPIAGVTVSSISTINSATYTATTTTDAGGNYSLPVFSATWNVGVDSAQLTARGYAPVAAQNVFVNTGTVPVDFVAGPLATAVSRKLHSGVPYDIPLPLTGNPGIECRSGGGTNDYQVVLTFGSAVTFNNATLSAGTGSVSSTSGSGTASITVNLTSVTNAQRLTVFLAGVNDGSNTYNLSVPMGVLVGDTNGNGNVSGTDIAQTKAAAAAGTVNGSTFRTDVNANGTVNASDVAIVKSRSGTTLPP
ncbi:MAG: dockerin type I domain-containing protein [Chthoniobacterales bacterium]